MRELAALGPRTGGTARGDRSAALVAARLRDLGLQVEIRIDPPAPVHEAISWSVTLDGEPLHSAHPWIHSPPIDRQRLPVILDPRASGAGSPAASPTGAPTGSMKGAALMTRENLKHTWPALEAHGPAAVFTDHPGRDDAYREWAFIGSLDPAEGRPSFPVFGLSGRDAARLRAAMRARGRTEVDVALDARNGVGAPRTVVGALPGAGARAGRLIVVCAHGDADGGGPGADDNASGVAALVEVARGLRRALDEGLLPASRPEVMLIVWGREYHSSEAWVRDHADRHASIEAVFNYDQVGTGTLKEAIYYEGNDIPWNAPLLRTMEAVAVAHGGPGGLWGEHTSNPSLGDTDAYAFLPRDHKGIGLTSERIPATTVFTAAWSEPMHLTQTPGWVSPGWPDGDALTIDFSRYYHSVADTPENTTQRTPGTIERAARLVLLSIRRLMIGADG